MFVSALIMIYGGFVAQPMPLLPFAAVFLALMAGMRRGWRSLAWLAFFATAFATIYALSQIWAVGAWWIIALAITSGLSFLVLFGSLWRAPRVAEV